MSGRPIDKGGLTSFLRVEELMNARITGRLLGACAAVALAIPLLGYPGSALAWTQGYSYGYGTLSPAVPYSPDQLGYWDEPPAGYVSPSGHQWNYQGSYAQTMPPYPPAQSYTSQETTTRSYQTTTEPQQAPRATEPYYGSSEPPPPRSYSTAHWVSAVDLNMHIGPGDDAPIATVLPAGTPVRVAGPGEGNWWQVRTPYGRGWVYSEYLSPG